MFFYNDKPNELRDIYVNELDEMINDINLIDIRERYEVKSGTIKGAKNIPMKNIITEPEKYLKKDEVYYLLCKAGVRSDNACRILRQEGYKVINVEGGVMNYEGEYFE